MFRRLLNYSLIGVITLYVISFRSPYAQTIDPPPAISLDFRCPAYTVSGAQPLTLIADILGTENSEIVKPLLFRWSISKGKIKSGQGTPKVTIGDLDRVETRSNAVRVEVVVEGGPPELGNEKSCVIRIDSSCSLAPLIDQYSSVSNDEAQHLDRFAQRLKASPPESIGYIISYAGKSACIYEANWRVSHALEYLVERHNIPAERIVTVDGGYRDEWTVELFIQPNTACGPLAAPTRKRVQVHVSGRCGSEM
jgi:hypothetical protein